MRIIVKTFKNKRFYSCKHAALDEFAPVLFFLSTVLNVVPVKSSSTFFLFCFHRSDTRSPWPCYSFFVVSIF